MYACTSHQLWNRFVDILVPGCDCHGGTLAEETAGGAPVPEVEEHPPHLVQSYSLVMGWRERGDGREGTGERGR